jgi:hypothetical protein
VGKFFFVFIVIVNRFFYNLCCCIVNERVQTSGFVFVNSKFKGVPVNCFNQLITLILYDAEQRGDFCQGLKEALYHLQAFMLGSQGIYLFPF